MAPQWAKISDRIGRKPTILIGSMGAVFLTLLFGFSTSIPMAIAARTCAGLLNPNLGVVQTFVGELVSKGQQGMTDRQTTISFHDSNIVILCHSQRILYCSIPPWPRVRLNILTYCVG